MDSDCGNEFTVSDKSNQTRAQAREKYRPVPIRAVLIAEAPPSDPDRFFYLESVRDHDSLYLETMKALFPGSTISPSAISESRETP